MEYGSLSSEEAEQLLSAEQKEMKRLQKSKFAVDMTRGRPSLAQLDIALPMLEAAKDLTFKLPEGGDARNYGGVNGIDSARELFAELFEVSKNEVMVADGSSLSIMYDLVQFAMQYGVLGSTPWNKLPVVKFICPVPGYDRHFAICQEMGIQMIAVPMTDEGVDVKLVESMCASDDSIKGIWCVPKYSNPTGITFSDAVVDKLAQMKAAKDFRIFWDNSYAVHFLRDTDDKLKNIFDAVKKAGNEDRVYSFMSTSKITFAGSGIAALASSEKNLADIRRHLAKRTIGPNKVNQLMHVAFLKNKENIIKIMTRHAALLRPKFDLFDLKMTEAFGESNEVVWSKPNGGYFISLNVTGCAKRIVELAEKMGVKFTPAGASFPYGIDDDNRNIRIAPSVPPLEDMEIAIEVLICAVKIALLEKRIGKGAIA